MLTSSPYPLQIIKGEELSWRKLAFRALELFGLAKLDLAWNY
jgi:hypothetical protein